MSTWEGAEGCDLRRAISTAYYALFHCVANAAADSFLPDRAESIAEEAWYVVYRALDHGILKGACLRPGLSQRFPESIVVFMDLVPRMQAKRHLADYHPSAIFIAREVQENIDECEAAIIAFEAAPETDRRAFLAFALFRSR